MNHLFKLFVVCVKVQQAVLETMTEEIMAHRGEILGSVKALRPEVIAAVKASGADKAIAQYAKVEAQCSKAIRALGREVRAAALGLPARKQNVRDIAGDDQE